MEMDILREMEEDLSIEMEIEMNILDEMDRNEPPPPGYIRLLLGPSSAKLRRMGRDRERRWRCRSFARPCWLLAAPGMSAGMSADIRGFGVPEHEHDYGERNHKSCSTKPLPRAGTMANNANNAPTTTVSARHEVPDRVATPVIGKKKATG